jgi:hypothetical protein
MTMSSMIYLTQVAPEALPAGHAIAVRQDDPSACQATDVAWNPPLAGLRGNQVITGSFREYLATHYSMWYEADGMDAPKQPWRYFVNDHDECFRCKLRVGGRLRIHVLKKDFWRPVELTGLATVHDGAWGNARDLAVLSLNAAGVVISALAAGKAGPVVLTIGVVGLGFGVAGDVLTARRDRKTAVFAEPPTVTLKDIHTHWYYFTSEWATLRSADFCGRLDCNDYMTDANIDWGHIGDRYLSPVSPWPPLGTIKGGREIVTLNFDYFVTQGLTFHSMGSLTPPPTPQGELQSSEFAVTPQPRILVIRDSRGNLWPGKPHRLKGALGIDLGC